MFVPVGPFQPSLMFASTADAYLSEAPISCCQPSLPHKHYAKLERPTRDKQPSLFGPFTINKDLSVLNTSPRTVNHRT